MFARLHKIFLLMSVLSVELVYSQTCEIRRLSAQDFVKNYSEAVCTQCTNNYAFKYPPFPLYPEHADRYFKPQGVHPDLFILSVPRAQAYVHYTGYVFINNCFIAESQIKFVNIFDASNLKQIEKHDAQMHLSGKAVIISHLYPDCYGIWILDVLSHLALLELHDVQYDYLCIPQTHQFMKETLQLWGIDMSKVIDLPRNCTIYADEIVMTTSVSQDPDCVFMERTNYYYDFLLRHVRDKLITGAQKLDLSVPADRKIFISRKDAGGKRGIANEDEIYEKFKPLGYARYNAADLTMAQKIMLFYHASSVICAVGSGSTNILFSQPGTHYIEMTVNMVEASFFFIASMLKLNYSALDNSTVEVLRHCGPWTPAKAFSLDVVDQFIQQHPDL